MIIFNSLLPNKRVVYWICLLSIFYVSACNPDLATDLPLPNVTETNEITPIPSETAVKQIPMVITNTSIPTNPATRTPTQTIPNSPAPIPTLTPIPSYSILRGKVLVRSNCRYGPGAPYLYKYGLLAGSNLEIIGRNAAGSWLLVRAIGGHNPCWIKASLMEVQGEIMRLAPTSLPLPQSPYYAPLRAVSAQRDRDQVTIFWGAVQLRPGDETASPQYLVEAWVCQEGKLVFIPIGVDENVVVLKDEAGCLEASHGQVLLAEKHGYTRPVEIPWPVHENNPN